MSWYSSEEIILGLYSSRSHAPCLMMNHPGLTPSLPHPRHGEPDLPLGIKSHCTVMLNQNAQASKVRMFVYLMTNNSFLVGVLCR